MAVNHFVNNLLIIIIIIIEGLSLLQSIPPNLLILYYITGIYIFFSPLVLL